MSQPHSAVRVAVAMSGGVDSSVAAALLCGRGYAVVGLTMRLWKEEEPCPAQANPDGSDEARRVCELLGIPFHEIDLQADFKHTVVDYFIDAYSQGITPNPCVVCNRYIKFGLLLQHARALGAEFLATGHYVQTAFIAGSYRLLRARDAKKDQSYVLYRLSQQQLARTLFPLGEYSKEAVRRMAAEYHLPVAERPDSQEICFISDNDYRRFLRQHAPGSIVPGPIFDTTGREIGRHRGLPFYTIGQRSGLGIALTEPLFVLDIDLAGNALVVGTKAEMGRSELYATDVSYVAGHAPTHDTDVTAKIRYNARPATAVLTPMSENTARVSFAAPLRDITPGQSVVFYQGEEVLGGGVIAPHRGNHPIY